MNIYYDPRYSEGKDIDNRISVNGKYYYYSYKHSSYYIDKTYYPNAVPKATSPVIHNIRKEDKHHFPEGAIFIELGDVTPYKRSDGSIGEFDSGHVCGYGSYPQYLICVPNEKDA